MLPGGGGDLTSAPGAIITLFKTQNLGQTGPQPAVGYCILSPKESHLTKDIAIKLHKAALCAQFSQFSQTNEKIFLNLFLKVLGSH